MTFVREKQGRARGMDDCIIRVKALRASISESGRAGRGGRGGRRGRDIIRGEAAHSKDMKGLIVLSTQERVRSRRGDSPRPILAVACRLAAWISSLAGGGEIQIPS